jgi:hypothetical protein
MLWEVADPDLFQKLFRVILTDNGSEFADPDMIENWRPDAEHNPTKLLPRGIHLFYCDAYCSSQKPHVEREHREERRILLRGVSFDTLDQEDINLVASHVASYTRSVLDAPPLRLVRREIRSSGQGFPRQAGHREDSGKQGHAQSDSPWEKVQTPCGQGHPQKGWRDSVEEA